MSRRWWPLGYCLLIMLAAALRTGSSAADSVPFGVWPPAEAVQGIDGEAVTFPSHSPYALGDVGRGADRDPATEGVGRLFLPESAGASMPVPAIVLLHGNGGVMGARELTYARQFAAMGVAALVVDVFAARRDMVTDFTSRVLNVTEAMFLADAYAALDWLAARPDVDGERVAVMGFSYGAMATMYAAQAQIAEIYAPGGARFAAHVSFYGPCIARFEDRRATGAPVLMLMGALDAIIDVDRCREVADDLEAGGAPVEMVVFPEAYHQWDGAVSRPREVGRTIAGCRLEVGADAVVRDLVTGLPMNGRIARQAVLALCVGDRGFVIGRDDAVRAQSNYLLTRFLGSLFGGRA